MWTLAFSLIPFVSIHLPAGCGAIGLFDEDCSGPIVAPPAAPLPPVRLAVRYLYETQLTEDQLTAGHIDYQGDWPQCFTLDRQRFVRDASPFMATFVHQALTLIVEENQESLGLTQADIENARTMRGRAIDLMRRFQARPPDPDAGTFGFWPREQNQWRPGDLILEGVGAIVGQGPQLMGNRAPVNLSFYPESFAIVSDADDTATIFVALLDDQRLDAGPKVSSDFAEFFRAWRDLGHVPRRNQASWLPTPSGAFLTWLAYGDTQISLTPNDVDLVVNANVLYALGRFDRLDTPGVHSAVDLINAAIESGAHLEAPENTSLYYPDNLFLHYAVLRALHAGGVPELAPAAALLVEDLIATVQFTSPIACYWDRGDAHLNTALAALALQYDRPTDPLIEKAINYLVSEQDSMTGQWDASAFFRGRLDSGFEANWVSSALTTALAMEALCRYQLIMENGAY